MHSNYSETLDLFKLFKILLDYSDHSDFRPCLDRTRGLIWTLLGARIGYALGPAHTLAMLLMTTTCVQLASPGS